MVEFARSARSTLGVEWELALVDARSMELVPRAPELLGLAADVPGLSTKAVGEMLTNTVELVTGVHDTVGGAMDDLRVAVGDLRGLGEKLGVKLLSAGTHPFSRWWQQQITDKERYAELVNRTQWWGRNMLIYGVHMHVGVDDVRKVMPIMNAMLAYIPHLQALSASSPFWDGSDTGYASNRAMMFQQLPTAGIPFQLEDWAGYEKYLDDMLTTGVIDVINEVRWDMRPSPNNGTLEVRVCDGMSNLGEIGALTALVQCLVDDMSGRLDAGETLPTMPDWFHRENKWRTARYGMDAIIIENAEARERLVTEVLADEVERLRPTAERLGCVAELEDVLRIAEAGAGYQRQRAVLESTGSLIEVARSLVEELETDSPCEAFGSRD
ncbi:glutamate--cysteine ligase [Brevibacterium samyangense]|uniref:Putative glutamate--cysteine ligase 2 n=1 Tax=Brevibacterium samyangense TaxID=366888 RepID=A0ABP5EL55_9MICO